MKEQSATWAVGKMEQKAQVEAAAREVSAAQAEAQTLRQQAATLTANEARGRVQLEAMGLELSEAQTQAQTMKEKAAELTASRAEQQSQLEAMVKEVAEVKVQAETLRGQAGALNAVKAEREAQLEATALQLSEAQAQVLGLKEHAAAKVAAEHNADTLQGRLDECAQQLSEAKAQARAMREQAEAATQAKAMLGADVTRLEHELAELRAQAEAMMEETAAITVTRASCTLQLETTMLDLTEARSQAEVMREKATELSEAKAEMQVLMVEAQRSLAEVEARAKAAVQEKEHLEARLVDQAARSGAQIEELALQRDAANDQVQTMVERVVELTEQEVAQGTHLDALTFELAEARAEAKALREHPGPGKMPAPGPATTGEALPDGAAACREMRRGESAGGDAAEGEAPLGGTPADAEGGRWEGNEGRSSAEAAAAQELRTKLRNAELEREVAEDLASQQSTEMVRLEGLQSQTRDELQRVQKAAAEETEELRQQGLELVRQEAALRSELSMQAEELERVRQALHVQEAAQGEAVHQERQISAQWAEEAEAATRKVAAYASKLNLLEAEMTMRQEAHEQQQARAHGPLDQARAHGPLDRGREDAGLAMGGASDTKGSARSSSGSAWDEQGLAMPPSLSEHRDASGGEWVPAAVGVTEEAEQAQQWEREVAAAREREEQTKMRLLRALEEQAVQRQESEASLHEQLQSVTAELMHVQAGHAQAVAQWSSTLSTLVPHTQVNQPPSSPATSAPGTPRGGASASGVQPATPQSVVKLRAHKSAVLTPSAPAHPGVSSYRTDLREAEKEQQQAEEMAVGAAAAMVQAVQEEAERSAQWYQQQFKLMTEAASDARRTQRELLQQVQVLAAEREHLLGERDALKAEQEERLARLVACEAELAGTSAELQAVGERAADMERDVLGTKDVGEHLFAGLERAMQQLDPLLREHPPVAAHTLKQQLERMSPPRETQPHEGGGEGIAWSRDGAAAGSNRGGWPLQSKIAAELYVDRWARAVRETLDVEAKLRSIAQRETEATQERDDEWGHALQDARDEIELGLQQLQEERQAGEQLRAQVAAARGEAEVAREEVEAAQRQEAGVREQFQEAQAGMEARAREVEGAQLELARQIEQQKAALEQQEGASRSELQAQEEHAQTLREQLQQELAQARHVTAEVLREEQSRSTRVVEELQAQATAASRQLGAMEVHVKQLELELSAAQQQVAERDQVEAEARGALQAEIGRMEEERESLVGRERERVVQEREMGASLASSRQMVSMMEMKLEVSHEEKALLEKQVKGLEALRGDLERSEGVCASLQAEYTALDVERRRAETEQERLQRALEETERETLALRSKAQEHQVTEECLEEATSTCAQLQDELAEAREENMFLATRVEERHTLEAELSRASAESKELHAELEAAHQEAVHLQERLDEEHIVARRLEQAEANCAALEQEVAAQTVLLQRGEAAEMEAGSVQASLQVQLTVAMAEVAEARQGHEDLHRRAVHSEAEAAHASEDLKLQMTAQLAEVEGRLSTQAAELAGQVAELKVAELREDALRAQLEVTGQNLRQQVQRGVEEEEQAREAMRVLELQVQEGRVTTDELQRQWDNARECLAEMQVKLGEAHVTIEDFRQMETEVTQQLGVKVRQLESQAQTQVDELEARVAALQHTGTETQRERAKTEIALGELAAAWEREAKMLRDAEVQLKVQVQEERSRAERAQVEAHRAHAAEAVLVGRIETQEKVRLVLGQAEELSASASHMETNPLLAPSTAATPALGSGQHAREAPMAAARVEVAEVPTAYHQSPRTQQEQDAAISRLQGHPTGPRGRSAAQETYDGAEENAAGRAMPSRPRGGEAPPGVRRAHSTGSRRSEDEDFPSRVEARDGEAGAVAYVNGRHWEEANPDPNRQMRDQLAAQLRSVEEGKQELKALRNAAEQAEALALEAEAEASVNLPDTSRRLPPSAPPVHKRGGAPRAASASRAEARTVEAPGRPSGQRRAGNVDDWLKAGFAAGSATIDSWRSEAELGGAGWGALGPSGGLRAGSDQGGDLGLDPDLEPGSAPPHWRPEAYRGPGAEGGRAVARIREAEPIQESRTAQRLGERLAGAWTFEAEHHGLGSSAVRPFHARPASRGDYASSGGAERQGGYGGWDEGRENLDPMMSYTQRSALSTANATAAALDLLAKEGGRGGDSMRIDAQGADEWKAEKFQQVLEMTTSHMAVASKRDRVRNKGVLTHKLWYPKSGVRCFVGRLAAWSRICSQIVSWLAAASFMITVSSCCCDTPAW
ncbi:hypothetical protein CYMTET_51234 [Cymbomonas tetramitiformis]|uniref:Uncharacterized protein n=1 Tax=Cymbomonas tetramitiformis TaxID=36881 RepID=A0AAE0BMR4_9CHLO|nr:hypothetical protein CYMTET_51234 [Cymbomonas tetramitiformis]